MPVSSPLSVSPLSVSPLPVSPLPVSPPVPPALGVPAVPPVPAVAPPVPAVAPPVPAVAPPVPAVAPPVPPLQAGPLSTPVHIAAVQSVPDPLAMAFAWAWALDIVQSLMSHCSLHTMGKAVQLTQYA